MNCKPHIARTLIATVVAAFAGAAMADDITIVADHFKPTLTREQVRAELHQARAEGRVVGGEIDTAADASSRARAPTMARDMEVNQPMTTSGTTRVDVLSLNSDPRA